MSSIGNSIYQELNRDRELTEYNKGVPYKQLSNVLGSQFTLAKLEKGYRQNQIENLLKQKHNIAGTVERQGQVTKMPYSVFKYEQPASAPLSSYSEGKALIPFDSPKYKKFYKEGYEALTGGTKPVLSTEYLDVLKAQNPSVFDKVTNSGDTVYEVLQSGDSKLIDSLSADTVGKLEELSPNLIKEADVGNISLTGSSVGKTIGKITGVATSAYDIGSAINTIALKENSTDSEKAKAYGQAALGGATIASTLIASLNPLTWPLAIASLALSFAPTKKEKSKRQKYYGYL